ncbi:MAG: ATPase [Pseudomonadota bacterium]|uniref:hypothetical protein n=1 Tax=Gallaecimonas pentaromativorans TaxID=584787 RepID=UPI00067ECA8C|nr:hypothetical protein [Gallaecimonas pentaromativorans]MED5523255.1 ATPase [Pseudomonadota bacterium]
MAECYGLTKLALLNTAGYGKCVLPLDKSVSVCAPNNTGKSSVINALQFPLINDMRLTEWDGHSFEETRKFYFATDRSYVLLEARLPGDRAMTIGVAGRGKASGYQYQYFCYEGPLDMSDYMDGKAILPYGKLMERLQQYGRIPQELKASELNALLTGGASPYDHLAMKLIPLNNVSDAPVYKEIFRRMLNLHKLTAQDVKGFMLKVFDRHFSNARIDFLAVWHSAFDRVNRMRAQLMAMEKEADAVKALEHLLDSRAVLKGKLAAYQPRLDEALVQWHDHMDDKHQELSSRREQLSEDKAGLKDKFSFLQNQMLALGGTKTSLGQWLDEYNALYQDFALVDEPTLKANIASLKAEYEELVGLLASAKAQPMSAIERRIKDLRRQLSSNKLQFKNLEYNLYSRLREDLAPGEMAEVSKLLNPDLLALSTAKGGEVEITDDGAFGDFLEAVASAIKGHIMQLPGATVDLSHLHSAQFSASEDKLHLKETIDQQEAELNQLNAQLKVAQDLEAKLAEKSALERQVEEEQAALRAFKRFEEMQALYPERQAQFDTLAEEEAGLREQLEELRAMESRLNDQLMQLKVTEDQFKRQDETLSRVKGQRIDDQLDLISGRTTPYMIDIRLDMDALSESLEHFNRECRELRDHDLGISNTYMHLFKQGISQFDGEPDEETRCMKLINSFHNLPAEREVIARQARAALVDVAGTLSSLRNDLHRLHGEMERFNQGITRHPISNLKGFKIEVVDRPQLVQHIDTILETSRTYESGESFDLLDLNQPTDDKALGEAKDYLIKVGTDAAGLTLDDLFDIRFKVTDRAGNTDSYDKIDSAGSNGTRITIKLLCGMLFIRQLLSEKERGLYRIPLYIDEAADIDPSNQRAIIDTARHFGFVPIFASVKPQISCDVVVPIRTTRDGTVNLVEEKDWIFIDAKAPEPESAMEEA